MLANAKIFHNILKALIYIYIDIYTNCLTSRERKLKAHDQLALAVAWLEAQGCNCGSAPHRQWHLSMQLGMGFYPEGLQLFRKGRMCQDEAYLIKVISFGRKIVTAYYNSIVLECHTTKMCCTFHQYQQVLFEIPWF